MPEHTPDHAVHFYESDDTLCDKVASFISEGLIAGQPGIVIATPAHCEAIVKQLAVRLIDVEQAKRLGDLVCLDAEDTLAAFMGPFAPDPATFTKHVGDVIEQSLIARRGPVRAYGEMVDVLWKQGRQDAAIEVELLWNELAQKHSFQLLCGYSMGSFFKQAANVQRVCDQHTTVTSESKLLPFKPLNVPRTA